MFFTWLLKVKFASSVTPWNLTVETFIRIESRILMPIVFFWLEIFISSPANRWRRASVSACEDLTNQLQCCWVDPACAWKNTDTAIACRRPVVGGAGTPRPVLLTGAKKFGVPD